MRISPIWLLQQVFRAKVRGTRMLGGERSGDRNLARWPEVRHCRWMRVGLLLAAGVTSALARVYLVVGPRNSQERCFALSRAKPDLKCHQSKMPLRLNRCLDKSAPPE